jgi:adhesin HecA-like repeat protein
VDFFAAKLNDSGATPAWFGVFADFVRFDDIADGGAFDFTAIGSGTGAVNAANGGVMRLSGAATTDNSGGQIQANGSHVATAGKALHFKTRCQITESTSTNSATESDLFLGFFPVDTSIEASLPADGIYFVKADGGTTISCIVRVGSSSTTITPTATAFTMDGSNHTYGISVYPNGTSSTVEFNIDGVTVARHTGVSLPASTVYLTPSVAFQSGDNTGTKWCDVDYVGSCQAR